MIDVRDIDVRDADHGATPPPAAVPAPYVPQSLLRRLRGGGGATAELVPSRRLMGPMPWVVAIMVAMTVIAAAAGIALANVARSARAELAGGITVQVLEPSPEARARAAAGALAVLRATPGVRAVRAVPQAEVDGLLSPWLGGGEDTAGDAGSDAEAGAVGAGDASPGDAGDEMLPVPALIDAHLDGPADPERLAALGAALRHVAPSARVDAQASWLKPVFRAISSLRWLALALIAVLTGAMAAVVLLAARTALGNHRETIEIVHMLGGSDAQIAGIFQRAIGFDAAVGGIAGLVVAACVILFLGQRLDGLGAGLLQGGSLGLADWVVLAMIPVVGVVLAVLTARVSVLSALRRML